MTNGASVQIGEGRRGAAQGATLRRWLVVPALAFIGAEILVAFHPYARRSLASMAVGAALVLSAGIETAVVVMAAALLAFRARLRTWQNAVALALGLVVVLRFWTN